MTLDAGLFLNPYCAVSESVLKLGSLSLPATVLRDFAPFLSLILTLSCSDWITLTIVKFPEFSTVSLLPPVTLCFRPLNFSVMNLPLVLILSLCLIIQTFCISIPFEDVSLTYLSTVRT